MSDAKIQYSAEPCQHGPSLIVCITPHRVPPIELAAQQENDQIHYEPDEQCPLLVSFIAGFQGVLLVLTPMVTAVTTTALVAGQSEEYLVWSAFAAILICGLITALQAGRLWRIGTGHVLLTSASVSLIVVSVPALVAGGPGLLAAVVVAGALAQFALSLWLPLLRRIITPAVTGTALMLLAATVIHIAAERVTALPNDVTSLSGPVVALITLVALAALGLRMSGAWRLWVPLIAIGAGCVASFPFGLYDFRMLAEAPWVGLPGTWFPDFEVPQVSAFFALLPMAIIVVMINGIKNMGDSVVVQRLSRRSPPATDYRLVQGSLNANGLGVLLSGLAGSPPTTINSATSGSLVSLTGVANRRVGYFAGAMLLALAFSPKLTAALLVIPAPVMGAYLLVVMGTYVVEGIRTVQQDGLDQKKALMVGLAFSFGVALENSDIIASLPAGDWLQFLDNGLTAGTAAVLLMTWFAESTGSRSQRLQARLSEEALPEIDEFMRGVGARINWDEEATQRLCAVGEEALWSLLASSNGDDPDARKLLSVVARPGTGVVELEFFAALEGENLQDWLAHISYEAPQENEAPFRLLTHYAQSVRHQKYHGVDIVRMLVADNPGRRLGVS